MDRSKYALVFSDDCMHNENLLEYVKKQVQKHHLTCEMVSSKDSVSSGSGSSNFSMLITATFDWLTTEVIYIVCIRKLINYWTGLDYWTLSKS